LIDKLDFDRWTNDGVRCCICRLYNKNKMITRGRLACAGLNFIKRRGSGVDRRGTTRDDRRGCDDREDSSTLDNRHARRRIERLELWKPIDSHFFPSQIRTTRKNLNCSLILSCEVRGGVNPCRFRHRERE